MAEQWTETYKGVVITAHGPAFSATIDGQVVRKPSVAAIRAAINKAAAAAPLKPVEVIVWGRTGAPKVVTAVRIDRNGIIFQDGAFANYAALYDPATFPMAEAVALLAQWDKLAEDERRLRAGLTRLSPAEIERRMRGDA